MYKNQEKMEWEKFFFFNRNIYYLAALGLSGDTQDPGGECGIFRSGSRALHCSTQA